MAALSRLSACMTTTCHLGSGCLISSERHSWNCWLASSTDHDAYLCMRWQAMMSVLEAANVKSPLHARAVILCSSCTASVHVRRVMRACDQLDKSLRCIQTHAARTGGLGFSAFAMAPLHRPTDICRGRLHMQADHADKTAAAYQG